jgi:hypothetical protein
VDEEEPHELWSSWVPGLSSNARIDSAKAITELGWAPVGTLARSRTHGRVLQAAVGRGSADGREQYGSARPRLTTTGPARPAWFRIQTTESSMDLQLTGHVVVVTAAAAGIGLAKAESCASSSESAHQQPTPPKSRWSRAPLRSSRRPRWCS